MHDVLLCLPFTDGALKGHFGKVDLGAPPLSVAVKLLCLQHVQEVECTEISDCEVSSSVRCVDDPCLASLDPVRTYFTIPLSSSKPQCSATIHVKCLYTSLTSISFFGAAPYIVFSLHPSYGFMIRKYIYIWSERMLMLRQNIIVLELYFKYRTRIALVNIYISGHFSWLS